MFKRFKSWILMIILAVLMIVYLIVRYAGSDERTFRDSVLSFDPATITEIIIKDPKSKEGPVDLTLTGDKWMVSNGNKDYPADSNVVKNILNQLKDLPTKRYAGKGRDVWAKYEVTDSAASLVTLKASKETVAEIYIGKFAYNQPKELQPQAQGRQQRGDMTTYVRLADEKDVYAVDGFLKIGLGGNVNSFRIRSLAGVNQADITRITSEEPGNRTVLENLDGRWFFDGTPADSARVFRYRTSVSRLTASKFIDQDVLPSSPSHSLRIEGNNFTPVQIDAYPVADTNVAYIITSSANPGSFFNGKEGGLFKKIWEPGIKSLVDSR
jgi:hypothetical protein